MWKNKMDDCLINKHPESRKSPGVLKKTVITTVLGVGLTFSVTFASATQFATVYHVYIDGEHVGIVDGKKVVESYVDQMIDVAENKYESYSLSIDKEISYVPERVFNPNASNEKVLNKLDEEVSVKVNAFEVKIGDKVFGYFKDKETAETILNTFKSKYVDLTTIEKLQDVTPNIQQVEPTLSVGASKVVDVSFSDKVSLSTEKVLPSKILTTAEGKKLLEKGTLEDQIHRVEEGEVLGEIANKYDLDLKTILNLNPTLTEQSVIQIGQEINVTDYEPYLDVIVTEEKRVKEKINFDKEVVTTDELYKGESRVKQSGSNGTKEVYYSIKKVNGQIASKKVLDEQVTREPVKEITLKGTKIIPSRGTGDFSWPTAGGKITSGFGERWGAYHKGLDIAGARNRSILAADNGVVEFAGWDNGGYGYKVIINHNNGYKTLYAHMSSVKVSVGQTVVKGSTVGVMGSTGNSTGVHLHFETYKNGSLINPSNLY